jgi:hypothetical protein
VGRGYQIPQLIEWGIQFLSPIIFYLYFSGKIKASYRLALAAVAMTFLGHGIYALGLGVGVPSYFLDMTISFFGFSENWARSYLMVAGILDMLILGACLFYFIKSFSSDNSKIFKNSYLNNLGMALIMWACVWGAVTAFARVIVIPHKELGDEVLYWAFETMVRLPHALIPLFVLIMLKNGLADTCAKSRD